ncbi:MAG: EAL domain-containing protein [Desulfomicrobium sp.]|nr:EAL domain-containing protein [Pseudomonadota bacterium]MBV1710627.1 EAL domain-containing protein [Desulfomicrobium sp.]MBU4570235.1 EAL domain-containing protein [Pseudomonadota bacterium]MBU4593155.1 EAL domain-containing protein [Pseudomonadota bacterium]MBV1720361.1 EAL domain-containing protein [Desulfomicrobium sp.]
MIAKPTALEPSLIPDKTSILLVEDNAIVAFDMQQRLQKLGYHVQGTVASGEEAIKAVSRRAPSLILMDIFLDGKIDGIEAAKAILENAQIPIIFLTGHDDEQTLNRAKITETFGYIIKPAESRDLHVAIEIALYKHAAAQALQKSEQQYRLLFDSMLNGFALHEVVLSDAGRPADLLFLDVNPAFASFFDLPAKDIIGRSLRQLSDRVEPYWIDVLSKTAMSRESIRFDSFAGFVDKHFSVVAFSPQPRQVAAIFEDTTRRKDAEKHLQHRTFHDALTNLPNRALCLDRIKQAMERSQVREDYLFAVVQVDIDRFKDVNDSLGHLVGDQLLQSVGRILLETVSAIDTVSRLGDDEFVVLLEELPSKKTGAATIKKIKAALNDNLDIENHSIHISACLGALFGPNDYHSPENYLQGANIALRHAQEQGLDQLRFYATEMQDKALKKLDTETRLRNAIRENEFHLALQPIFFIGQSPILSGFEALLRWKPKDKGWVPPSEFIPIAEQTGLILPIGQWVLEQSCKVLSSWAEKYPGNELSISVNLSARQFSSPDLVQNLFDCLRLNRVNPSQIKLEITESDVMTNPEATIQKLRLMKELGVAILVDDFGTGYSSMSYLQRFPIDTLKIDRSFVTQLDKHANRVIVRTIVNLAHSLGLSVVAEGIETEPQYLALREMGCEFAQGYHFSRPILPDQVDEFIALHLKK